MAMPPAWAERPWKARHGHISADLCPSLPFDRNALRGLLRAAQAFATKRIKLVKI